MSIRTRTLPLLAVTATLGLSAAPATAGTAHHHGDPGTAHGNGHGHGHGHKHGKFRTCGIDRVWLKQVTRSDLAEIATGQLAQQKGTSQGVKALGAMLVADHTKHLQQVQALAGSLRFTLPTAPSPTQAWGAAILASLSGTTFDTQWTAWQIAAHQENIELTQDEIDSGCNRHVRALAKATLPVLQAHLAEAQKLAPTS